MATESWRIERDINVRRSQLGSDIDALEGRVRRATDWRVQFDEHPWAVLGGAEKQEEHSPGEARRQRQRSKATETLDNVKSALVATAVTQVRNFLVNSVPSFRDNYADVERKNRERDESTIDRLA